MKVIKKYRILQVSEDKINDTTVMRFSEPESRYISLYSLFESEEEAIEEAYKFDKWLRFTIIPIYSFDNY